MENLAPAGRIDDRNGIIIDIELADNLKTNYTIVANPNGKGKLIYQLNEYMDP